MRQNIGASNVLCEQVMRGEPKNKFEKFQLFEYSFCKYVRSTLYIQDTNFASAQELIHAVVPAFPIVPDVGNSGFFFPGHYNLQVILAIQSVWLFSGRSGHFRRSTANNSL
jgi:hypothetical protein